MNDSFAFVDNNGDKCRYALDQNIIVLERWDSGQYVEIQRMTEEHVEAARASFEDLKTQFQSQDRRINPRA